jgi:Predicted integral membrane protein
MTLLSASPLITSDPLVLGILLLILAFVLTTSSGSNPFYKKFYRIFPPVLLCYFIPGILNTTNIISGEGSPIYHVASRYLLPASLVLLIMSVDLNEVWKLRRKAGAMFFTGAFGIVIGGPLALLIVSQFSPGLLQGQGEHAAWRGLATLAGSWTGGSANMAALYEVFKPSTAVYSGMIAIDVIVANCWLATLLFAATRSQKINRFLKADDRELDDVKKKIESYQLATRRIPSMPDLMSIVAIGLAAAGLSNFLAGQIAPMIKTHAPQLEKFNLTSEFFWLIVFSTTIGLALSFTRARKLEGAGATNIGSLFLYILIAAIGMQMNILNVFTTPSLLAVGLVWISIHIILMIVVARVMKVHLFFLATASEANIGGAPTASLVAAAFHPALVPVAVLLAVLGYAIGNYAGYICGILMQLVSGG